MKRIVAEWPALPRTSDSKKIAIIYALILIVMTTVQLFSFEKFIPLLESFDLPSAGRAIAVASVVCGVFALPFLLQMKLSVGFRWLSMIASWAVPLLWLFLMVWVNVRGITIDTTGVLGADITTLGGWWAVCMAFGLGVLAAWASWGLWPRRHRSSSLERPRKK